MENVVEIRPMLHFRNFVFFYVHVFQSCSMLLVCQLQVTGLASAELNYYIIKFISIAFRCGNEH